MSQHEIPYKIYLQESEMPTRWYNLRADMKNKPAPLLNPATLQPCKPEELEAVFCADLVRQELDDTTLFFDIPQEVREYYRTYRPSPLVRAYNLEKKLGTPAKIYYKFEGKALLSGGFWEGADDVRLPKDETGRPVAWRCRKCRKLIVNF